MVYYIHRLSKAKYPLGSYFWRFTESPKCLTFGSFTLYAIEEHTAVIAFLKNKIPWKVSFLGVSLSASHKNKCLGLFWGFSFLKMFHEIPQRLPLWGISLLVNYISIYNVHGLSRNDSSWGSYFVWAVSLGYMKSMGVKIWEYLTFCIL